MIRALLFVALCVVGSQAGLSNMSTWALNKFYQECCEKAFLKWHSKEWYGTRYCADSWANQFSGKRLRDSLWCNIKCAMSGKKRNSTAVNEIVDRDTETAGRDKETECLLVPYKRKRDEEGNESIESTEETELKEFCDGDEMPGFCTWPYAIMSCPSNAGFCCKYGGGSSPPSPTPRPPTPRPPTPRPPTWSGGGGGGGCGRDGESDEIERMINDLNAC